MAHIAKIETLCRGLVLAALLQRPRKPAEAARSLGVKTRDVQRWIADLRRSGFTFERIADHRERW